MHIEPATRESYSMNTAFVLPLPHHLVEVFPGTRWTAPSGWELGAEAEQQVSTHSERVVGSRDRARNP